MLLSPVFLLVLLNRKTLSVFYRKNRVQIDQLIFVAVLFLLGGLAAWILLYYGLTTIQFFSNVSIPLFSLMVFLLFCIITAETSSMNRKVISGVIMAGMIGTNMYYNALNNQATVNTLVPPVSRAFLEQFQAEISRIKPVGASFRAAADYRDLSIHHIVESTYSMDRTFGVLGMQTGFHTVSLTSDLIAPQAFGRQSQLVSNIVQNSTFKRYQAMIQDRIGPLSQEDLQLRFLLQYDIEYLLVSAAFMLPESIKSYYQHSFSDHHSGYKLYIRRDDDISTHSF
jgi:hypothetical protein